MWKSGNSVVIWTITLKLDKHPTPKPFKAMNIDVFLQTHTHTHTLK